jgi:hypothetical protein
LFCLQRSCPCSTTENWAVTAVPVAVSLHLKDCAPFLQEPDGMAKVQNEGVC